MKKRIVLFLAAILPAIACAYDAYIDGIYYNFDQTAKTANVTYKYYSGKQNAYSGTVIIPASVTYNGVEYNVTSIGNWAFSWCSGLTSVTMGNSVTSIGVGAFSGCNRINSIYISDFTPRPRATATVKLPPPSSAGKTVDQSSSEASIT